MLYFSKSSSAQSPTLEGKQTAPPSIQTEILHMVLEQLSIQPDAEKRLFVSLQSSIAPQSLCITSSFVLMFPQGTPQWAQTYLPRGRFILNIFHEHFSNANADHVGEQFGKSEDMDTLKC